MAQNSIARLAVQIVTDTQPLTSGFQRASVETTRFASTLQGGNVQLSRLGRISADAAKELAGLGGAGKLAFKFGAIAGPVGLATTSIAALAIGLARLADAGEDFRIDKLREVGELTPGLKTASELFGELREQLTIFAELSGFSMKPLLEDLRDLARSLSVLAFGEDAVANLEKQNAAAKGLAEQHRKRKEAEEEAAKAAKQAADEAKRQHDELVRRGESVAKSLRTPFEIFQDTLNELKSLHDAGVLSGEILQRGIKKASDDYGDAVNKVKELKRELVGVPALEIGTQAARTAILSNRTDSASSQYAKQQIELQKRIAAAVEAALKKPPVTFNKASI